MKPRWFSPSSRNYSILVCFRLGYRPSFCKITNVERAPFRRRQKWTQTHWDFWGIKRGGWSSCWELWRKHVGWNSRTITSDNMWPLFVIFIREEESTCKSEECVKKSEDDISVKMDETGEEDKTKSPLVQEVSCEHTSHNESFNILVLCCDFSGYETVNDMLLHHWFLHLPCFLHSQRGDSPLHEVGRICHVLFNGQVTNGTTGPWKLVSWYLSTVWTMHWVRFVGKSIVIHVYTVWMGCDISIVLTVAVICDQTSYAVNGSNKNE